jgi:thymidylate synthase
MKQYLDLLQKIKDNGTWKPAAREGMPKTLGITHGVIEHDMKEGFPLLTTKQMHLKGILTELIWFLRGDTNIKYLLDKGVNIWNKDAYKYYIRKCNEAEYEPDLRIDDFIEVIRVMGYYERSGYTPQQLLNVGYYLGDLGSVYGSLWRDFRGVDQLEDLIIAIDNNPFSRYHLITAWDPSKTKEQALPSCHMLYQFTARKDSVGRIYLDLSMVQRSCDTFLGVPYNVASIAALLLIICNVTNTQPGKLYWTGNDVHIYEDHIEQVETQLKREPFILPDLRLKKKLNSILDIMDLEAHDFELTNYNPHPKIKGNLSVGI